MNALLARHRCHDSMAIIRRWQAVARAAHLRLETLYVTPSGFPVIFLETKHQTQDGLYLSAGVHGDEPAPVVALLEWAEANIALLRVGSFVLLPLFNPAGLKANTRGDEFGTDLNRSFHDKDHPHFTGWHRVMQGRRFSLGVMLHEDYDARGIYVYELSGTSGLTTTPLLDAASRIIPPDTRHRIDGFSAKQGVIKRRHLPRHLPGMPEALEVYRKYALGTFTFESPSEFCLAKRVAAHRAVLDVVAGKDPA